MADQYDSYEKASYVTAEAKDKLSENAGIIAGATAATGTAGLLGTGAGLAGIGALGGALGVAPLVIGGGAIVLVLYYMYRNKESLKEGHDKRVEKVRDMPVGISGQNTEEAVQSVADIAVASKTGGKIDIDTSQMLRIPDE